jgi:hypothetical protein
MQTCPRMSEWGVECIHRHLEAGVRVKMQQQHSPSSGADTPAPFDVGMYTQAMHLLKPHDAMELGSTGLRLVFLVKPHEGCVGGSMYADVRNEASSRQWLFTSVDDDQVPRDASPMERYVQYVLQAS